MDLTGLVSRLPSIKNPKEMLSLEERLKNTVIILILYFLLASIPLFGVAPEISSRFQELAWVFGSNIGTLATLGIGPIIMASIFLQLFIGGGIIDINIHTPEGRIKFMQYEQILTIFFILFESFVMLALGTIKPDVGLGISPILLDLLIFLQLVAGSYFIVLLDEYSAKYGLTSGINLFILASISKALVIRLLNPYSPDGRATGYIMIAINSLLSGDLTGATIALLIVAVTLGVLVLAAYLQTIDVEIPFVLARVQGRSIRYPIKLLYTSVIPVILLFALIIQIQSLYMWITGSPTPPKILLPPRIIENVIPDPASWISDPFNIIHVIVYFLIYVIGAAFLSWMWVHAAGMDAESIAEQLSNTPLLQGRDPRVIKKSLEKYIRPISILSGILVGGLAAIANILGSALAGTSLLLLVMISYNLMMELERNGVLHMIPIINKFARK